jgi:regulator of sigma E protease
MVSILIFIVVLSLLILIHEGGHYFAARRMGVWVEEFGLGLPPRAWGKKVGNTIYSLNWLPFGGFVRLHGESLEDTITDPKVAFLNKGKAARAFVITAGVIMNIVLGLVAFSIVYTINGIPRELGYIRVEEVLSGSPADTAGLKTKDKIISLGGESTTQNNQFINLIDGGRGTELTLQVEREGELLDVNVTPREDPPEGEGALGVAISSSEIYFPPVWQRPAYGVYYGVGESLFWSKAVIGGLGALVGEVAGGHVPKDIAGPVGIYQITAQTASLGLLPLINFIGILSINLAVVNILPIPALDGGRLVFILYEAVTKRRITPKIEAYVHGFGMLFLLALIVLITFADIKRIGDSGGLGFFQQFFN